MRRRPELSGANAEMAPSALDLATARRRALLRARVEICAGLRRQGASSGVGAAGAAALRLGEEAAAELAGIPDTPELRRLDAALLERHDGAAPDGFEATVRRLAEEYRSGRALDLFTASPTELLACCVARASPGRAWAGKG
jgi:hypothetical protein